VHTGDPDEFKPEFMSPALAGLVGDVVYGSLGFLEGSVIPIVYQYQGRALRSGCRTYMLQYMLDMLHVVLRVL
jgi:hypothetical protein